MTPVREFVVETEAMGESASATGFTSVGIDGDGGNSSGAWDRGHDRR